MLLLAAAAATAAATFVSNGAPDVLAPMGGTATTAPLIGLCTWFTFRFESSHLLPWVAHHIGTGIDHVFLYVDDYSPSWEPDVLYARQMDALNRSGKVTVFSMANDIRVQAMHPLYSQIPALNACSDMGIAQGFAWMGMWDLDEYMFTNSSAQPIQPNQPSALRQTLQRAQDAGADGVLLPRVNFVPTVATKLPAADGSFEFEGQTGRKALDTILGKPMWRVGRARGVGPHAIGVETATVESNYRPSPSEFNVLFEDGRRAQLTMGLDGLPQNEQQQDFAPTAPTGGNPPLALAHLITRSEAECEWKLTLNSFGLSWRDFEGHELCAFDEDEAAGYPVDTSVADLGSSTRAKSEPRTASLHDDMNMNMDIHIYMAHRLTWCK